MNETIAAELTALRGQIDAVDEQLMVLLGRRFRLTDQVGELKARYRLDAVDPAREHSQMERIRALAVAAGVAPALATTLLRLVIDEVVDRHHTIANRSL